jgi:hypothetical protein
MAGAEADVAPPARLIAGPMRKADSENVTTETATPDPTQCADRAGPTSYMCSTDCLQHEEAPAPTRFLPLTAKIKITKVLIAIIGNQSPWAPPIGAPSAHESTRVADHGARRRSGGVMTSPLDKSARRRPTHHRVERPHCPLQRSVER